MLKGINKVTKILIYNDFFFNSAWGFLGPVFAIFIVQKITIGSIAEGARVVGFSTLFYWVLKSILQIPIGKYLDKNHGEKDDFTFLVLGTFLTGLVPFGYLISSLPWHIYALQCLEGLGMAMLVPSWYAIFTRHIDKGKEAFEWSINSTSLGLGVGITGALGGIMVGQFGFTAIFVLSGVLNMVSALLLLIIRREVSPYDKTPPHFPALKPF